jgi:transposase
MTSMNYIGLDVHKKTISYCVKDVSGRIQQEGKIGSNRRELDSWMKTLPQPWMVAMEATIFNGWIYDHLLPHAAQIKVTSTGVAKLPKPRVQTRLLVSGLSQS